MSELKLTIGAGGANQTKCGWHRWKERGFMQAYADAEARMDRGEKQRQCPDCRFWYWEDEFGTPPKTERNP